MHIFQAILRIDISFRGNSSPEATKKNILTNVIQLLTKKELKTNETIGFNVKYEMKIMQSSECKKSY